MTLIYTAEEGYLERPYLEDPYLSGNILGNMGQQANFSIVSPEGASVGQQVDIQLFIDGWGYTEHGVYLVEPYLQDPYLVRRRCAFGGQQANFAVTELDEGGQQAEFHIEDFLTYFGQQAEFSIEEETPFGMQADLITLLSLGQQVTVSLYNTTNLRIMCDFPSRGLSGATGNNSWGNPAGTGQSWAASSTEAGDFSENNLNTDIVEQVWRSNGVVTGITLDCDTERTQGVFLDTLAILNHNFTSSASITLIGSNSATFSSIGFSTSLAARSEDPNIYYIAEELPASGFRYWRIAVDDASNADGFLQVGTIVFGASSIFVGECFVDEVEFNLKDFADKVDTEGFTNVSNSRAQKKLLRLDFRSLDFTRGNFRLMRSVFQTARTVLKCLWIPTPDPINQEYTARFALFAKMSQVPTERHNNKGRTADYVTFTLELDESL